MRFGASASGAKSHSDAFSQRMALSSFLFKSSRKVPTLFVTSPTVDFKEYAPSSTDIRFDIPLIGQAPFIGQSVGMDYRESTAQFNASFVEANDSEYTEVSCFDDSLKDCDFDLSTFELLAEPPLPPSASGTAIEDILSDSVASTVSSASPWDHDAETDADVGMTASCSSPEDNGALLSESLSCLLSTPVEADQSHEDDHVTEGNSVPSVANIASIGPLASFFGNDCSSEGRSSASLSVYSCDSALGGSIPPKGFPESSSRAPAPTSPHPATDQSLPLDIWDRYTGDMKAEADWNSILMQSSYESEGHDSSSDCSFHLPITPPQLPTEPKRARIARDKEQSVSRSPNGAGLEAWWTEEPCSFDLFPSTKRHAIYVEKENFLGFL
jgi:hypothetical protein